MPQTEPPTPLLPRLNVISYRYFFCFRVFACVFFKWMCLTHRENVPFLVKMNDVFHKTTLMGFVFSLILQKKHVLISREQHGSPLFGLVGSVTQSECEVCLSSPSKISIFPHCLCYRLYPGHLNGTLAMILIQFLVPPLQPQLILAAAGLSHLDLAKPRKNVKEQQNVLM